MRSASKLFGSAIAFFGAIIGFSPLDAQLAPTGEHYAGRPSDTGQGGSDVTASGIFAASIPLDLPTARGDLPIPLRIAHSGQGVGAAGQGWDIPLSFIQYNHSFAYRRPTTEPGVLPAPKERMHLSLLGRQLDLVQDGNVWRARSGTPQLIARLVGDSWRVYDGASHTFTFTSPQPLTNAGFWLLQSIAGPGGNQVQLTYNVTLSAIDGGDGVIVDLIRLTYNTHPQLGCPKHEIDLSYGPEAAVPISLSVLGNQVLVRKHILSFLDVKSRADCSSLFQRLRRYEFQYQPDADTQLPRLHTVHVFGRQGTPEETIPLPIATYDYGTATHNGALEYRTTQAITLPAAALHNEITGTQYDSAVNAPVSDPKYAMWQSLTDVTSDGRPDLIFQNSGKLWVALNQPGPNGTTTIGANPQVVVLLSDATLTQGAFSTHSSKLERFAYAPANRNTVDTWRQAIDVNGDGRVDIIDAAEQPNRWVVYLNTPGPSGVKWERRSFSVLALEQMLTSRGHILPGNYLPLSRRATGTNLLVYECWQWDGSKWVWYPFGFATHVCEGSPQQVVARGPERTIVEWQIMDVNGDGYPDFVFDGTPVDFQVNLPSPPDPHWSSTTIFPSSFGIGGPLWRRFEPRTSEIRVALNVRGVRFDADQNVFALSFDLHAPASVPVTGVSEWRCSNSQPQDTSCDQTKLSQYVGLADINGDGMVDRVVGRRAYLGAFHGTALSFLPVYITLPGLMAANVNTHLAECGQGGSGKPTADETQGLRDLSGDGIPDYFDRGRVWIGTGTGFAPSVPVTLPGGHFSFSHETETCDGKVSKTDGGLFDIDGDGRPDVIGLVGNTFLVSQLVGDGDTASPDAGRLIGIANGYGAQTRISYVSAKEFTDSPVSFPEIVATSVLTTSASDPARILSGVRYAYSNAHLIFDSTADRFVFPGYGRTVAMRLFNGPLIGDPHDQRPLGAALITDTWPLAPFTQGMNKEDRWLRELRTGQIRDRYSLRGTGATDPWSMLNVDANDTRVISATHFEWGARLFETPFDPAESTLNCIEMVDPLDYRFSFVNAFGDSLDTCRAHGFPFATSMQAYRGASPPPSTNNVQTETRVLEVDDLGRATRIQLMGDRFRSDDDVCVETNFAMPVARYPRNFVSLSSQRVNNCKVNASIAGQSWVYDGLAPGLVSEGHVTTHFVERRTTDTGQLLSTIRKFDATYNSAGDVMRVSTQRGSAMRTAAFHYDPFGLLPVQISIIGIGVPITTSATEFDPLTLDALNQTDANGTKRGSQFDGYGRLVRSTLTLPGGQTGIRAEITYSGYAEGDPSGRRIATKGFADPVSQAAADVTPARTSTLFLDELGHAQRTEVQLGADYGNGVMIVGQRLYDMLGRIAFEADPHLANAAPATIYGTTYHYKMDGEPACFVRGFGIQPLTNSVDAAQQRFPTCFNRTFSDHVDTLEVQGPDALQNGSPQAGVTQRIISSAIGRAIERQTRNGAGFYDRATFTHDRLGQLSSMTRFQDPGSMSGPVQWSWQVDSIGQVLRSQQASSPVRQYQYSDWGEVTEIAWNDGTAHRLVRSYDALGRLVEAEEQNNGVTDPDTVDRYSYDSGPPSAHLNPTFLLGRLAKASAASGDVSFSYDELWNINGKLYSDPQNGDFVQRNLYHADGRLAALDFELPDTGYQTERVKYGYDSADRLRSISYADSSGSQQLYQANFIDAFGHVRNALYGATTYHAAYSGAGRDFMTEAAIDSPFGSRQWLYLDYDPAGRVLVRREILNGAGTGTKFNIGYGAGGDVTNQTTSAGAAILGSRGVTYDALGNIANYSDALGNLGASLSFDPANRDRICRIGYGAGGLGGTICNVVQDGAGNVIREPTRNGVRRLRYFNSGLIRSIDQQGASAKFSYDPFGQVRELDVASSQDKRQDVRFGDLIEKRGEIASGTGATIFRHIPGPDGTIATRHGASGEWIFEFGGEQGNRVFTDAAGKFVQEITYQPFGEAASTGAAPGTPSFTSYQWNYGDDLAAFGLVQLGARIYDPVIGRFLSQDPILAPRFGASSNPYAFALNDPVNKSDASGLQPPGEGSDWYQPYFQPLFDLFGSSSGSGQSGPAIPPPPSLNTPQFLPGEPAISENVVVERATLQFDLMVGFITRPEASQAFRDFLRSQVYTNQKDLGSPGFCACASKQMALKHGGIIDLGLSYKDIKQGLRSETSSNATQPGQWEYWHFNETMMVNGRSVLSHPDKLGPDAISQIARNSTVGTGTTDRLRLKELTAKEARDFLDQGALVIVGTSGHWLTVVRDPFAGNYVYLDPYADTRSEELLTSRSISETPWGTALQYDALIHE